LSPFQNKMAESNNPHDSILAKIKQTLDPAYSYIVFEKAAGTGKSDEFNEIIPVLSLFKRGILEQEIHRDEARGRLLLVVKVAPKEINNIKEEFLKIKLPEDITFYLYGSHPGSGYIRG